jgi:ribosomal protein S18 acetylase RimI-like enzyme
VGAGGGVSVVTTYLELTDPEAIRPAGPPRTPAEIVRVNPPDGAINRWCYETVGADWSWTDHLGRDDAWWQDHAEQVETWVLLAGGDRAGYVELRPHDGQTKIEYFGLLAEFHGLGLGGHLLEFALRRGFALGRRVWVHTCTLDGPHALANYRARGLVSYRVER